MRIDLKKYLFVGNLKERDSFFKTAQEVGIIHFINTRTSAITDLPADLQKTASAIKVLRSLPVAEQEEIEKFDLAEGIVDKILKKKEHLDKMAEQQRIAQLEIARFSPLGNYSMQDIHWIEKESHRKIQFYCAKEGVIENEELSDGLIHVASGYGLDYFIALHPEQRQYEKMIELKPEASLDQLQDKQKKIQKDIYNTEHSLKELAKYNTYLHHFLIHQLNHNNLYTAESYAQLTMEDQLFAVEGWVPQDKIDSLQQLTKHLHVYTEEVAIEPEDSVPTCLENEGIARLGEDLVHIYDTPSTSDKDPSLWVLFFFALFFAMIIGDAGYGLALFLGAYFYQRSQKKITKVGKRVLKLVYILCAFTVVWGILITSFFGISFSLDSPIRNFSLVTKLVEKKTAYYFNHVNANESEQVAQDWIKKYPALQGMKDPKEILNTAVEVNPQTGKIDHDMYDTFADHIMIEIALLIGIIHLSFSFFRYIRRNIAGLGWIVFMIGGFLYFTKFLGATSIVNYVFGIDPNEAAINGLWLMYGGIGFAVIVSIIKDKFFGLLEAMNVIQVFSDVMSYLRIYALGLAGALVTVTMTDLAQGLHFVLAALLLILAHVVNLTLGVMSGVIHGLRLNFLEWYHYSFEGGGKKYNPLRKKEIE